MDSLESGFLAEAGQERAAPTRQKSCNACVRGKRRCDKRTPRCSRCAAKGLDCVYQRMPPHDHSRRPAGENAAARAAPASSDGGTPGVAAEVPEFDMAFDMADALGSDTSPDSLRTDASLLDAKTGPLEPSLFDLLTPPMSGGSDDWNLLGYHSDMDKMYPPYLPFDPSAAEAYPVSFQNQQPPQQQQQHQQHQQQPRQQQQQLPVRDLSLLKAHKATCLEVDPLHVHDPRTRLGFIVAFLSSMPDTLASTRTLPCMHPRLWAGQLPKPILSAFSAATAYRARSPQTRAWTVKLVADASRDIQREGERAATSAVDKLARVQALFVVNLMRFFDGDIGLRAAAEREAPVLLAWTKDLIGLREELEEEAMTQKGPSRDMPPKSWDVCWAKCSPPLFSVGSRLY